MICYNTVQVVPQPWRIVESRTSRLPTWTRQGALPDRRCSLPSHTEVLAEAGHGAEEIATLAAAESRRLFGRGVRVQSVEGEMNGY